MQERYEAPDQLPEPLTPEVSECCCLPRAHTCVAQSKLQLGLLCEDVLVDVAALCPRQLSKGLDTCLLVICRSRGRGSVAGTLLRSSSAAGKGAHTCVC
jgi:hypothetical protein